MDSLDVFVLCGRGGIEKTEIAMEYMFSRKAKFDVIFWISADTEQKLSTSFVHVSKKLGLEDEPGKIDEISSRDLVKGWLSCPQKSVIRDDGVLTDEEMLWLIVFDNVDNPEVLYDY